MPWLVAVCACWQVPMIPALWEHTGMLLLLLLLEIDSIVHHSWGITPGLPTSPWSPRTSSTTTSNLSSITIITMEESVSIDAPHLWLITPKGRHYSAMQRHQRFPKHGCLRYCLITIKPIDLLTEKDTKHNTNVDDSHCFLFDQGINMTLGGCRILWLKKSPGKMWC